MPDDNSQTPHSTRDLSNTSEEKDLWELGEDGDENQKESPLARLKESTPPTPYSPPNTEDKATKARQQFKPAVTKEPQGSSPNTVPTEAEQKPLESSDKKQKKEESTAANRLSVLEKISLGLFTIALLGLGIYGYIWLYNKNIKRLNLAGN